MIFDTGFVPEHFFCIISGGVPDFFVDYAVVDGSGVGGEFAGQALTGSTLFTSTGAISAGTEIFIDNTNVDGVSALCPPETGTIGYAGDPRLTASTPTSTAPTSTCSSPATSSPTTTSSTSSSTSAPRRRPDGFGGFTPDAGQNSILANNQPIDFGALTRLGEGDVGDPPVLTTGLTFDTDFAPTTSSTSRTSISSPSRSSPTPR
jgi:hypothetical protein